MAHAAVRRKPQTRRPNIRPEQVARWLALARAGLRGCDIEKLDGVPSRLIGIHVGRHGVRFRDGRPGIPAETLEAIHEELAEGVPVRNIAARYDYARYSIYLVRHRLEAKDP